MYVCIFIFNVAAHNDDDERRRQMSVTIFFIAKNSNITITQCQKNFADCVTAKIYNHDVTLTLYIN